MTRYIAAYDTEMPGACLVACRTIRDVHERFGFDATFFIQGTLLEADGPAFRALLGDVPQFEIASHTYSHQMLRDHPFCGPAIAPAARLREIRYGKTLVEQTFGRPCVGMRPGCGFDRGLRGDPWLVKAVADAGFGYISSVLWGPEMTVPALLEPPFTYAGEGCPDLWEMPGHGWHENLLKGHNLTDRPQRILAWPSPFPEAIRLGPIATPEEEFAMNRLFIDRAIELDLPYVSLIWHPWSLARFDPAMTMLAMTFAYVRERGLEPTTFAGEQQRLKEAL
ncbi:MAG TPA: polysaccharide deacetylase family protein [Anaerolineae bacterium]|nr:polysaccharide deacetylase family protein [Anaerolineae bacterium]HQI84412.1 polysaccharide deacetylase family protein [Anaerolineae bacterium]